MSHKPQNTSRWYITDIHRLDMVHILYIMLNFDEVYISDIPPAGVWRFMGIYPWVYTSIHRYTHTYTQVYTWVYTSIHMYTHTYTHVYTHVYTCIALYTQGYTGIHKYTHPQH